MKHVLTIFVLLCLTFNANAMSVIRRITNSVPPTVTNNIPTITNSPSATWKVKEIKNWNGDWKVMIAQGVPRGLVVSIYNRKNREESEIHEMYNGKWQRAWSGKEETIGAEVIPESATAFNGKTYFAAERGSTFLQYDHNSGKVSRAAKVPDGYKWNVFTVAWNGTVVVGADGPDKTASVFDAVSGKKLLQSPLDGLIAGMTVDNSGILWMAISDGNAGICNSAGWSSKGIKPSSVCFAGNLGILAGSQVDGSIVQLVGSSWIKIADLDCSKINRMVLSKDNQFVFVSGAKPDTFVAINIATLKVTQIARFNDEAKDSTGEQFDTEINELQDNSLVLGRANKSGAHIYSAIKE